MLTCFESAGDGATETEASSKNIGGGDPAEDTGDVIELQCGQCTDGTPALRDQRAVDRKLR